MAHEYSGDIPLDFLNRSNEERLSFEVQELKMVEKNERVDFDRENAIPATEYENLARKFIPGYDGLYSLAEVLLSEELADEAKILVVGAGGGKELLTFGKAFPKAKLFGVDPSEKMLAVAKELIENSNLNFQVELLNGVVTDVRETDFDAATAVLVMHFLPEDEKTEFLKAIYQRLEVGGKFIIADVCFDKKSEDFEWLLKNYKRHAGLKGVSPEITEQAVKTVTENVFSISPEREIELLKEAGFTNIRSFFQGLWVRAWVAEKV